MRVLLIEDEKSIVRVLTLELTHEGYTVESALDGQTGLDMALAHHYDIILLDIMLPSLDGLQVLTALRKRKSVPVILLTARDSVLDKVEGLDLGANDYMTKPFHIEELLARMRVLLRDNPQPQIIAVADLVLNEDNCTISRGDKQLQLTRKEYELLAYFMHNPDTVLTREKLLSDVWGYDFQGDSNIVDVYVRYVRVKVNEGFDHKHIDTVRGAGYILKGEDDIAQQEPDR